MTSINEGVNNGPMLNAYPDSMGGTLTDIVAFFQREECQDAFSSLYILPSVFHTDLDRGFSVIDYSLNERLASKEDLEVIKNKGIDLKLDFILNHASVLSEQFQDIIKKGKESKYCDFFIDWNEFWIGKGEMTEEGYIQPEPQFIKDMFFRKPGLPILMVRFPDGKEVPYWNTFYQEVKYPVLDAQDIMQAVGVQYQTAEQIALKVNQEIATGKTPGKINFEDGKWMGYKEHIAELLESRKKYLGQMDLNIKSPLVWQFYEDTLVKLANYGAKIVRLDAFAYAPKEPGEKNFLNEPGSWEVLERVKELANQNQLTLLPEIHASYAEKNYETISAKGYLTYDFFLPGLIIDALENGNGERIAKWANELLEKKIRTVNMLGCHDGIPLLDLKGILPEEEIQNLIQTVVERGGYVKDLHGQANVYYQVNATYYSALGEDDRKMLLARALQLFMPGKPQVWYLDLFAGKNDIEAMKRAGTGGHKEINRTNLTTAQIDEAMNKEIVRKQIQMLQFRTRFPAFDFEADCQVECKEEKMIIIWKKDGFQAKLDADLKNHIFCVQGWNQSNKMIFELINK